MNISRNASGAISVVNPSGSTIWLISPENAIVKNDELNVIVIFDGKVYTWPIEDLSINSTPFVGTAIEAAESIATEVFTTTP